MNTYLLKELEAAVAVRNPLLAEKLQPGLSEKKICALLKLANINGAISFITQLYCWKNGTLRDRALMVSKIGMFPNTTYYLSDLSRAIVDMKAFKDYWKDFPKLFPLRERYFPAFWDGDTCWMALDLESNEGRIVLIRLSMKRASLENGRYEPQVPETEPPREAYSSFGEFVADAIQANRNNKQMTCFYLDTKPIAESTLVQAEPIRDGVSQKAGTNMKLIPATENALVLRTDFSDESAWQAVCAAIHDPEDELSLSLDFVSDRAYDGLTAEQLPALVSEESPRTYAFIVDRVALMSPEHPILAVDLHDQPGRMFRVASSAFADVECNLSISNMGFEEFANAVDQDGIFRGFSGS